MRTDDPEPFIEDEARNGLAAAADLRQKSVTIFLENLLLARPSVLPVAVCASSCSCNYLSACGAEDRHCHVDKMRIQLYAPTSQIQSAQLSLLMQYADNQKPYKTLTLLRSD